MLRIQTMVSKFAPVWDRISSRTEVRENGCHIYTGGKDDCGYGRIGVNNRYERVHRLSWEKHFGQIPDGMCVCHRCDTPACYNLDHLFLGTHAENMADRARKGRYDLRGTKNPSAKLTADQVERIRAAIAAGKVLKRVAEEYGVTDGMIGHIKAGRAWA